MRYIKYTTKNEKGEYEAMRIQATDSEIDWLIEQIGSPKHPAQISFKGQMLISRNVEVLSQADTVADERTYPLDTPEQKKFIHDFERELAGRHFLDYCKDEGLITFETEEMPGGTWTDDKPNTRRKNISVIEPADRYEEACKLNATLDKLIMRREWSKRNEQMPEINPEGVAAYQELKNEIMPEDIF